MNEQYKVVEGSQSAHCCFVASVVDLKAPVMIGEKHYNHEYEQVCECFSMKEAEMIAKALNQRAELLDALKEAQDYIRFGQDFRSADEVLAKAITQAEAAE